MQIFAFLSYRVVGGFFLLIGNICSVHSTKNIFTLYGKYDRREQKLEYLLDSYKESLMPLMVDKMLAKGALDGRNEIVSLTSLFELEGAITTYTVTPH